MGCLGVALACLAALSPAPAAVAAAGGGAISSLPRVATGHRPGPDILYAPPAVAPQLTNTGIWQAPSILVSGATEYRDGEFIYQDFLDDDHGAAEQSDPQDQRSAGDLFSRPAGTYTYPTDPRYANNAADLVEFRVKPALGATAFRVTLATMRDPSLIAFSIALGGQSGVTHPFPDGANVVAPADLFLTVHPDSSGKLAGYLTDAVTGAAITPDPAVSVDTGRAQVQVLVPNAAWDPTGRAVRMALGVGLWDAANHAYLLPLVTQSATEPGGGGGAASPAAFFNIAFRTNASEPMPKNSDPAGTAQTPAWWRDSQQAAELAAGDISPSFATVDFGKLAARVDDESGVPATGGFDRILQSHFGTPATGNDWSVSCFPGSTSGGAGCKSQMQGNLQPYAIYVPAGRRPAGGYGLTLLLHSLSAAYNQYLGSRNQVQYSNRGIGSIVVTPSGRGPDGFYDSYAGADTFEVWADVARHYRLDPDWTVVSGYSMGGMGSFKLATQFPDLFARLQSTVGYSAVQGLVPSLRNVPVQMWNMATDELVPEASYYPTAMGLDSAGYRYTLQVFTPGEHLTLAINDQFQPAADFLGTDRVDRNPAHVTYVVDPALDYPALGFVADHAYWLSGLRTRSSGTGTIDVVSHGFGVGDPTPSSTAYGAGALTGGTLPAIAYASQGRSWGPVPAAPVADVLDVNATNIAAVTIDPIRARVDCAAKVNLTSDGPTAVTLTGCPNASSVQAASANRGSSGGGAGGDTGGAGGSAPATAMGAAGLANTGWAGVALPAGVLLVLAGLALRTRRPSIRLRR